MFDDEFEMDNLVLNTYEFLKYWMGIDLSNLINSKINTGNIKHVGLPKKESERTNKTYTYRHNSYILNIFNDYVETTKNQNIIMEIFPQVDYISHEYETNNERYILRYSRVDSCFNYNKNTVIVSDSKCDFEGVYDKTKKLGIEVMSNNDKHSNCISYPDNFTIMIKHNILDMANLDYDSIPIIPHNRRGVHKIYHTYDSNKKILENNIISRHNISSGRPRNIVEWIIDNNISVDYYGDIIDDNDYMHFKMKFEGF